MKQWLPLFSLASAGFIFVTTELMPIGLLPNIAQDMGRSEAFTGLLVTVYAWLVALLSLPLTILTGRLNRRTLLLILLTIFSISQWLAALAPTFNTLLGARLLTALCHALYWSVAPPLAVTISVGSQAAKALMIMAAVVSLAAILGMPLGTLVGQQVGWRWTFVIIGFISALIAILLWRTLPSVPGRAPGGEPQPLPWSNPTLRRLYLLTALVVTGHYSVFTYLNPLLAHGGFSPSAIAWLLLTLGASGILGNLIVTRHFERHPKACLLSGMIGLALCLTLASVASHHQLSAIMLCMGWGISMGATTLVFQTTVIKTASDSADQANSLYSAIFNVGIGSGALIGNKVFDNFGISQVNYGGAIFVVSGIGFLLYFFSKSKARASASFLS